MKTVLVTGGAGFLGSCLSYFLVDRLKYEVVVIDDLSGGFIENLNSKVKFYEVSINDIESIDTTNSILALKEYRHFFQYLFVNKKLSSVNDIHSNEKKKRISSMMKKKDGKALTLLICSDLKEMPTKKNDILTLSGALAL